MLYNPFSANGSANGNRHRHRAAAGAVGREYVMSGLPLVGDEFAGYRVRSVLGRGGMSVVYQAENLRLSSVIALKVLAPELATDDVFRARFLEESRMAASLNHPNVIPIYDMGSQDDLLYIAMRYVSGTDMRQMIKKRGRILPATAFRPVHAELQRLRPRAHRGRVQLESPVRAHVGLYGHADERGHGDGHPG
jgi:serine/threonine protein kinase